MRNKEYLHALFKKNDETRKEFKVNCIELKLTWMFIKSLHLVLMIKDRY